MDNNAINFFFINNYNKLIIISKDYSKRYDYNLLEPDEIISELYLYTLQSIQRQNKLEQLILLSAATINYPNYDSKAIFYIIKMIFNVTKGKRLILETNMNKSPFTYKNVALTDDLVYEENDKDEFNNYDYTLDEIYQIAKELGVGEQWWQYKCWYCYYHDRMTYKQIASKYHLSTTPVFQAIKLFNTIIKNKL